MTHKEFGSYVASVLPELTRDMKEGEGLLHLQMMSVHVFARKCAKSGDRQKLSDTIKVFDKAFIEVIKN